MVEDGNSAGGPIVIVRDVCKDFHRNDIKIPVLIGINLELFAGDYLALMGPSGSGKSTLLNLVAGLDRPTSGTVTVVGQDLGKTSESELARWRSRHIGFIFQLYNLIPVLTAYENVELPLTLTRLSRRERDEHVRTALEVVGLTDRMDHYPRQLSGGQEQRVSIARAIATDPTLLVADEPTGDLDATSAREILELMERLNQEFEKTIIMVTHDPNAADRAGRLVHLEKGVLVDAAATHEHSAEGVGMKTLKYIWRNVTRNKLRTLLTIFSVGFSLALMTVLHGYMAMQDAWGSEAAKNNRIVVMNTQGFAGLLPIAYVDRVRRVEGVKAAVPYAWFGGIYKDEQMPFAQFATDPEEVFNVWDEFTIDPKQLEEWQDSRQGCVADRRLAARKGWEIGERIPLRGTFYPYNLDLVLTGTFDSPQNTDSLWFHWNYLEEGLKQMDSGGAGNSGTIFAKVESSQQIPRVCQSIDDRFASSNNPTRSQTEAAFAQMFTDMLGNIQAYIRNIGLAVVFSLSLVAANSMAMSMRERTTEIAVLKAIGFSRGRVMWLVLGEACGIALLGGLFGVAIGCGFLEALHNVSVQFFPFSIAEMAGMWLIYLLLAAAGIGLISGIVPAVRAAQLSVVNGLRQVV